MCNISIIEGVKAEVSRRGFLLGVMAAVGSGIVLSTGCASSQSPTRPAAI